MPCTRHRVFLATLIVAAKYLNDSSPKNKHWAVYAVLFDVLEINLMEKQLLFLLDYDLRFEEDEACALFAPFMAPSTQRVTSTQKQQQDSETRTAAVDRVTKAGKARAQAQIQMPPTPPHDAVAPTLPISASSSSSSASTSTLVSAVRGIAKRLSTSHLPTPTRSHALSQAQSLAPSPMYSTLSTDSASGSEMGSLIDDCGSSSSSCMSGSEDEWEPELEASEHSAFVQKKFALRPLPSYAHRQYARNRNASDTSSIKSTTTITGANSPTQRLAGEACARRMSSAAAKRASSISVSCGGAERDEDTGMVASTTMPSIARAGVSGGFLSRMWGVATKAQEKGSEQGKANIAPPVVDIVDPAEVHPHGGGHGGSAFRRLVLVHSRSAAFRTGAGSVVDS